MSANFWNDIDDTLVSTLQTEMGAASSYATQKLRAVYVTDQWDIELRESTEGDMQLPCAFVIGREWEPGNNDGYPPQGPSFGTITIEIAYEYELIVATEPATTYAVALSNAKELLRRVREAMRDNWALGGLTSTDGERIVELHLGRAQVDVRGFEGGTFIGGGYLPVTVYSAV